MVARAGAVPLDELDPLQLLLGLTAFDDEGNDNEDAGGDGRLRADSVLEDRRYHERRRDDEDDDDERREHGRRNGRRDGGRSGWGQEAHGAGGGGGGGGDEHWTGEAATSVEMRSPSLGNAMGMGLSALRQSFSPMTDVFLGPYNSATETPAASQGGSPDHLDPQDGDTVAVPHPHQHHAHGGAHPHAHPHPHAHGGFGGHAGYFAPVPSLPMPIGIPTPSHMKRKLAFRGTHSKRPA